MADPNRHTLVTTESTTVSWMTEFFNTTSNPTGHGFSHDNLKSGIACYSLVPKSDIPIKFIVLDDTVKGPGRPTTPRAGSMTSAISGWSMNSNAGQAANQLMVIAAHVPILPQNSLTDTTPFPMWPGPEYTDDYVLNMLHQYPNLILWMAGHRHVNVVTPQPDPHGDPTRAFWEVETCSLRDHPQQFRTFDIRRNSDNTVSIIITNVDPAVVPGFAGVQVAGLRVGGVPDFRCHSGDHLRHYVSLLSNTMSLAVVGRYVLLQKAYSVRGKAAVLACWNMVIPFLCPDLPAEQKEALHYGVKVPLVYTVVGLRSWTAFHKLGVRGISCPGMYHTSMNLDQAASIGDYKPSESPEEPILVHMLRTPCQPGLSAREQQRAGHYDLLATSFETFERNIRDQFVRVLSSGGFDPARDIEAITVNRWPHGYAYEYNPLWDPDWPEGKRPCDIARRPFGRITIANSDAAAAAYTDQAIDQGYRAVRELLSS